MRERSREAPERRRSLREILYPDSNDDDKDDDNVDDDAQSWSLSFALFFLLPSAPVSLFLSFSLALTLFGSSLVP